MEKENEFFNKNVETYAEDVAKVIGESEGGGLIKKIIEEQEEHEAEKINLSPQSKKNRLFMFLSLAFVLLASVILVVFLFFEKDIYTTNVKPVFKPIIFTDQSSFQEVAGLTKDQITQSIIGEIKAASVKMGGVEGIYLTENKQVVGLRKFISLLKGNLGLSAMTFISDNFLIGAVNQETKNLFILLQIRSFADIFGAMRTWEAKMLYDLHGLFGVDITAQTNYLFTKNFEDGVIQNRNARILYDQDGKIILFYVFAGDTHLIIANIESTAREVMLRLSGGRIEQ